MALLIGPAHALHDSALSIFRRVAEGKLGLIVIPAVVAEVVYVTESIFGWNRAATTDRVGSLLEADGLMVTERTTVFRALGFYGQRSRLDFADAYLAAVALEVGPAAVASFDRDFDAVAGIRRVSA